MIFDSINENLNLIDAKSSTTINWPWAQGTLVPVLLIGVGLITLLTLPRHQAVGQGITYYTYFLLVILALYLLLWLLNLAGLPLGANIRERTPLLSAVLTILVIWQLITLNWDLLPLPYFPSPAKILEALVGDSKLLLISTGYSLRLLAVGYFVGAGLGLITGTAMGWYSQFRYWINPLVRIIGPIPSSAWIPLAMVIFPNSFSASVYLISLATWFPVTVMTWSGISNINQSFFEAARTLGADEKYLITRVAIPGALPMVFIGLFMGLGVSFVTLIVAEMLGVKAGLGWYIQWAQGWGEYYKVYAGLIIMAAICSFLMSLLFIIRDHLLVWQRGLIKW
ncbi:MAG: ABC transporter permease [Methylocystaceae bacterium]